MLPARPIVDLPFGKPRPKILPGGLENCGLSEEANGIVAHHVKVSKSLSDALQTNASSYGFAGLALMRAALGSMASKKTRRSRP